MTLLREQIVERDSPACAHLMLGRGLLKWFEEVDACLQDFADYDEEDATYFWIDVGEEMQMQHSAIEYCRSELEEIIAAKE